MMIRRGFDKFRRFAAFIDSLSTCAGLDFAVSAYFASPTTTFAK
jgi:hypothetical protein